MNIFALLQVALRVFGAINETDAVRRSVRPAFVRSGIRDFLNAFNDIAP